MSILDDNIIEQTDILYNMPDFNEAIIRQETINVKITNTKDQRTFFKKILGKEPKIPTEYKHIINGIYEYKNKYIFTDFPEYYLNVSWHNSRINLDEWDISVVLTQISSNISIHDNIDFSKKMNYAIANTCGPYKNLDDKIKYDKYNELEAQTAAYNLFVKFCTNPSYLNSFVDIEKLKQHDSLKNMPIYINGYSYAEGTNSCVIY